MAEHTTEWRRWAEQIRQSQERVRQQQIQEGDAKPKTDGWLTKQEEAALERAIRRQQEIQESTPWHDKPTKQNPVQTFESGATRNTDTDKYDYEGFLNPEALHAYGDYMHEHRHQRDGSLRDADNWQKGIPFRTYVKSLVRHTFDLWRMERGFTVTNPDTGRPHTKKELCCAIVFNAMGYLKELVDPAPIHRCKTAVPEHVWSTEAGSRISSNLPKTNAPAPINKAPRSNHLCISCCRDCDCDGLHMMTDCSRCSRCDHGLKENVPTVNAPRPGGTF